METLNSTSSTNVSVLTAESTTVSCKSHYEQVPVLNGQHIHPPLKMLDPLEIFKQTVREIFIHFLFPWPTFWLSVITRLECRKVIQPQNFEATKFPDCFFLSISISFFFILHDCEYLFHLANMATRDSSDSVRAQEKDFVFFLAPDFLYP